MGSFSHVAPTMAIFLIIYLSTLSTAQRTESVSTDKPTSSFGMIFSRRSTLMFITFFHINLLSVVGQSLLNVKAWKEKALYGYSFLNISEATMGSCMERCLENCRCQSFQLCDNKTCELCSSNKDLSPSAFREREECTYFSTERDLSESENPQCHRSCLTGINCCMTSNPCQNGGTCEPAPSSNNRTRFRCKCLSGYTGKLCQRPVYSCRDYVNESRKPGVYQVLDSEGKPFHVYCDFDMNLTWTLIQSYELRERKKFNKSLVINHPVNEENPSWKSYRLSLSRMQSIRNHTSKWRMTCQYESDGVVYTDYVRAAHDKIDILTYDGKICKEVEYINVRGWNCSMCTIWLIQSKKPDETLHTDSYYYTCESCDFRPSKNMHCGGTGEDNFGLYICINQGHRCSANETSTTQTWFGG